jgi:dinuclear metal center YbgI/SA1388 family protein
MQLLTLDKISDYLNQLLPSKEIIDYCPNGLQIEGKHHIKKIGTAVSASLATLEQAIEQELDVLIVHHGLFWQKDSYVIQGSKKQKIALLLKHDISLFAYHLPLDLHTTVGNNWKAAFDLQLADLKAFGSGKMPIGVQGKIKPLACEDFKQKLEQYYQHPAYCALGGKKIIETVAIVSGGAHRLLIEAAEAQVDAFITGSFDEPTWHQAFEEKINFFALGHSATERVGPLALADHLQQVFQLPCVFIENANPF